MSSETSGLTLESVVQQTSSQVHVLAGTTTVILSLANNSYFSLDAVGSAIWSSLAQPVTVQQLCTQIMAQFRVDAPRCELDTLTLLGQMIQVGLVRRH